MITEDIKILEKIQSDYVVYDGHYPHMTKEWCVLDKVIKELKSEKCKWILYDYRTLAPREHGEIPNPYWRIPARYKVELKYCPYCGREIDYSEVDAEIKERKENNK